MITIDKLQKSYGKLQVLDNVNTSIRTGKVTVLIGPNGSGKSTLIKCILGLVKPSSGDIKVNDVSVSSNYNYRKDIGYVPQYGHFPENLLVKDVFNLVLNLRNGTGHPSYGIDKPFDLTTELKKKIYSLSGGTRQKLSANLAFMFNPQIYICDEPTAGLDPIAARTFKQYIQQMREEDKTILLSSHVLSEVEHFADDIIFICEGRLKYNGPLTELKIQTNESTLEDSIAKLME
ncbi:MAG: ABC transporter ATP-binding protein [Calditrichaeota bacterium]|nr:MAG: ABC transporter ATP-binding protein [Calditrichota bacterium]